MSFSHREEAFFPPSPFLGEMLCYWKPISDNTGLHRNTGHIQKAYFKSPKCSRGIINLKYNCLANWFQPLKFHTLQTIHPTSNLPQRQSRTWLHSLQQRPHHPPATHAALSLCLPTRHLVWRCWIYQIQHKLRTLNNKIPKLCFLVELVASTGNSWAKPMELERSGWC